MASVSSPSARSTPGYEADVLRRRCIRSAAVTTSERSDTSRAAQLPEIYREALDRVDLAGQSHHDAAIELGISTSGMKSRVQRARRQLEDLCRGPGPRR